MTKSHNKLISIYSTFPSQETAESLAEILLSKNLIACANIFPRGLSLYKWKGQVQKEEEVYVFFKTSSSRLEEAIQCIKENHPFDVPAIIQFQPEANLEYISWLNKAVDPHQS